MSDSDVHSISEMTSNMSFEEAKLRHHILPLSPDANLPMKDIVVFSSNPDESHGRPWTLGRVLRIGGGGAVRISRWEALQCSNDAHSQFFSLKAMDSLKKIIDTLGNSDLSEVLRARMAHAVHTIDREVRHISLLDREVWEELSNETAPDQALKFTIRAAIYLMTCEGGSAERPLPTWREAIDMCLLPDFLSHLANYTIFNSSSPPSASSSSHSSCEKESLGSISLSDAARHCILTVERMIVSRGSSYAAVKEASPSVSHLYGWIIGQIHFFHAVEVASGSHGQTALAGSEEVDELDDVASCSSSENEGKSPLEFTDSGLTSTVARCVCFAYLPATADVSALRFGSDQLRQIEDLLLKSKAHTATISRESTAVSTLSSVSRTRVTDISREPFTVTPRSVDELQVFLAGTRELVLNERLARQEIQLQQGDEFASALVYFTSVQSDALCTIRTARSSGIPEVVSFQSTLSYEEQANRALLVEQEKDTRLHLLRDCLDLVQRLNDKGRLTLELEHLRLAKRSSQIKCTAIAEKLSSLLDRGNSIEADDGSSETLISAIEDACDGLYGIASAEPIRLTPLAANFRLELAQHFQRAPLPISSRRSLDALRSPSNCSEAELALPDDEDGCSFALQKLKTLISEGRREEGLPIELTREDGEVALLTAANRILSPLEEQMRHVYYQLHEFLSYSPRSARSQAGSATDAQRSSSVKRQSLNGQLLVLSDEQQTLRDQSMWSAMLSMSKLLLILLESEPNELFRRRDAGEHVISFSSYLDRNPSVSLLDNLHRLKSCVREDLSSSLDVSPACISQIALICLPNEATVQLTFDISCATDQATVDRITDGVNHCSFDSTAHVLECRSSQSITDALRCTLSSMTQN